MKSTEHMKWEIEKCLLLMEFVASYQQGHYIGNLEVAQQCHEAIFSSAFSDKLLLV